MALKPVSGNTKNQSFVKGRDDHQVKNVDGWRSGQCTQPGRAQR